MPFNTPLFLYGFLPVTLAVWRALIGWQRQSLAQWWVVIASLFFYGFWNWRFLPIPAFSVTLNFHLGRRIAKTRSKPLLVAGLAFNLGLLAYFK